MALSFIDDHSAQALARVAQEYKQSTRLLGIIESVVDNWQELDNAFWQLATERYLFTDVEIDQTTVNYEAEGVQLDVIGRILGLDRAALTDDEYRLALKAKIKVIHSSGTGEELIDIFATVEPDATVTVATEPPAYVTVTLSDPVTAAEAYLYRSFLRDGRAAGVAGTLLWQESSDATCLTLSNATAYPETDTLTGLGDTADTNAGGYLTGAGG